jgi:hypothetical protein
MCVLGGSGEGKLPVVAKPVRNVLLCVMEKKEL